MSRDQGIKFRSVLEFLEFLPEEERLIVDVLRQIVLENLPSNCREKFAYNVPFYYGQKRICLIWPAAVPRGGVRQGVLFGFCYGNLLPDETNYLSHGTNKRVYYRIYRSVSEIDERVLIHLLKAAIHLDGIQKQA